MLKFNFFVLAIVLFLHVSTFAQSDPLTITGGRLGVFDGSVSKLEASGFSATGSIPEHTESAWYWVCHAGDQCNGGSTFHLPYSTGIGQNIGTALPFERGNITVGGQTYSNAYYKGNFIFSTPLADEQNIVIPRYFNQLRKGERRITRPFHLLPNSTITACKVSMINGPCPEDQVIFSRNIQGSGTLTITLRYNNQYPEAVQGAARLIRKNFEYRFGS